GRLRAPARAPRDRVAHRGAARTGRAAAAARARRVRGGHVLLPVAPANARARPLLARRGGRGGGRARRPFGRGKDDRLPAAAAFLRPVLGPRAPRRHRRARRRPPGTAPEGGGRGAGPRRLRFQRARERTLRPTRGERGGGARSPRARERPRLRAEASRRDPHAAGRARREALRRTTTTHRHRARDPRRSRGAAPRRGHELARRREREGRAARARAPDARTHHPRHRASPRHSEVERPHRRDGPRARGRHRQPCLAGRRERPLRSSRGAPVRRRGRRMKGTPILWGVAIASAALAHGADVPGAAPAPAAPAVASAQRSPARELLDRIPGRAALLARIRALGDASPAVRDLSVEAGRVFYLKTAAHAPGPVLCVRDGFEGAERVLVDPLARADGGPGTTIAWYSASPDGHHVAFGLGRDALAGTAVLHVLDVDHGRDLPFEIDRAAQNGHLAWQPDGKSFYYARAPEAQAPGAEGAHVRIYRHVLGRETARDEVVFAPGVGGARDIPEMVEPRLVLPRESRYAFALVRSGPGAPVAVHVALQKELAAGRPRWHEIATTADEVVAIEAWHDDLYLLTHRGATNRRVLRVAAGAEDLAKAKVAVPEGDAVIEAMGLARDGMYLRTMVAGVDRLERMRLGLLASGTREFLRLPYDMAIAELVTDPRRNGAVLRLDGWTRPPEVAEVDARTGDVRNTNLVAPAAADYSSIDEVRLYAPAPDGTRIPVTLLYERSTRLTADNPTLLTVYGAWGDPASPVFDAARLAWLERGGVFAVAHVRGGGEYGDA